MIDTINIILFQGATWLLRAPIHLPEYELSTFDRKKERMETTPIYALLLIVWESRV